MNKQLRFNLQFFADDSNEPSKQETETHTNEDYAKLKKSFDTTASELATLKKQLKDKMSDEEKKSQEQKDLIEKMKLYEQEIENNKIEKELLKGGFSSEEVEEIIKEKNGEKFYGTLVKIFNKKLENQKKIWEQDLINKTQTPRGTGGDTESFAMRKAKQQKDKEEPIKWGNF